MTPPNTRPAPRRAAVLAYIATHPGASNREIALGAGAIDEGQLSKLLSRAEFLGLVVDRRSPHSPGAPRQWHLTAQGELAGAEAMPRLDSWSTTATSPASGPATVDVVVGAGGEA